MTSQKMTYVGTNQDDQFELGNITWTAIDMMSA